MIPYVFSALTMKSVGKAALAMIYEVRRQIRVNPGIIEGVTRPDYKACIKVSTQSSLK
jgi:Na+/H+-translocating membrane pyrophosphatase